ncbi:hypothetical protein JW835_07875 [bacterium]|nr:hypothetical protein [bacterium]
MNKRQEQRLNSVIGPLSHRVFESLCRRVRRNKKRENRIKDKENKWVVDAKIPNNKFQMTNNTQITNIKFQTIQLQFDYLIFLVLEICLSFAIWFL